jgi:arsenite methyltransferase
MEPKRTELPSEQSLASEDAYFELQAFIGTTKHMGGLKATQELTELCHITQDSYVLDVGCGAGATPAYLAKQVGCRVVAVDVREKMIALAEERVGREGLADRVELRVADAHDLPFGHALFDAVIVESVTSFIPDKPRALAEFARVTKPGGYVGLNEETWLKAPPPDEMVAYVARTWGGAAPATVDAWKALLESAGLGDITATIHAVKAGREASQVKRYHTRDMLRMAWRTLRLYPSRAFRRYMRERGPLPKALWQYLGYGLYVGRK